MLEIGFSLPGTGVWGHLSAGVVVQVAEVESAQQGPQGDSPVSAGFCLLGYAARQRDQAGLAWALLLGALGLMPAPGQGGGVRKEQHRK